MKLFVFVAVFLLSQTGFSQDFAYVPVQPLAYERSATLTPANLSAKITAPYTSERDKVHAIFSWIADNISYKLRPWYARPGRTQQPVWDDDTSSVLKPLNERVAENVLRTSEAVCDGYSRLFATLCSYANIRAEVVTGYSRVNASRAGSKFRSNHSWNAVMIDSVWHLLDVTWASGYISFGGDQFIRHYSEQYFLTPPKEFIYDHYPENLQWTLLSQLPEFTEFKHTPFKSQRFIKSRVVGFKPERGLIEAFPGDTIQIEVETSDIGQDLEGTYDPSFDSSITLAPPGSAYLRPQFVPGKAKIQYTYIVPEEKIHWLNLVLHDEVLMRYQLVVKYREIFGD